MPKPDAPQLTEQQMTAILLGVGPDSYDSLTAAMTVGAHTAYFKRHEWWAETHSRLSESERAAIDAVLSAHRIPIPWKETDDR